MSATEPLAGERARVHRMSPVLARYLGAAVLLVLVAVLAFQAGRERGNHVRAHTGRAYVGDQVASVKVDGRFYGVSKSVAWVDHEGASHEDGWPTCLGPVGASVRVRFGEIGVRGPQGDSWREVVWVDCRGAERVR